MRSIDPANSGSIYHGRVTARETRRYPTEEERDEPLAIPSDDPAAVLRAMLAVKPDDEPVACAHDDVDEAGLYEVARTERLAGHCRKCGRSVRRVGDRWEVTN